MNFQLIQMDGGHVSEALVTKCNPLQVLGILQRRSLCCSVRRSGLVTLLARAFMSGILHSQERTTYVTGQWSTFNEMARFMEEFYGS